MVLHNKAVQTLLGVAPKNDPLYVGIANRYAVFFNQEVLFATMLLNEPPVPINAVLSHIKPCLLYTSTLCFGWLCLQPLQTM